MKYVLCLCIAFLSSFIYAEDEVESSDAAIKTAKQVTDVTKDKDAIKVVKVAIPSAGTVALKPIDYDALLTFLTAETKASWDQIIEWQKEDELPAEGIKSEERTRDAYLAVLEQIKKSNDVNVKNKMIEYEFLYGISTAISDAEYAETAMEKLKCNAKVLLYRNKLKEFKAQVAAQRK